MVIALALIRKRSGERIKTSRRERSRWRDCIERAN
jgi:hypothetical protein